MTGKRPRAVSPRLLAAGAWLCVIVTLVAAVATARADVPAVTAALSDSATTVGEPVELRITVTGAGALGRVQPPEVDGLSIQSRGTSQNFLVRNFAVTEQNSYLYLVTPRRAGVFTLPETEVQVGGRGLRTPPLTLSVTANPGAGGGGGNNAAAGAQVRAELLLPKRTAYVGETLPAEFRLSFGPRVELVEPSDAPLLPGEGFTVGRWTQPQTTGPRGFGGNGGGGSQRLVYKSVISGARPGTLRLGPGETVVVVRVPSTRSRSSDPFSDDPLGGLLGQVFSPPRQVKVRADAVALEVRPLPTAGQPTDFTGGVGRFELGAAEVVSPARGTPARAGDPVVVRLTVRGQGSFDRLGAPLPDSTEGLRFYEPKDRFKADDDVGLNGTKFFEQTFIPAGPRDGVPGFHLSYFDPVTGTYQSLRTPPVPLKILAGPAAAVVAPETATPGAPAASPAAASASSSSEEALRPLRADPGVPVAADVLRAAYARPGFWRWQLVPLGLIAAVALGLRVRARSRDATRRRRAARAREREQRWRTVRDPQATRRALLDAAVRLLEGSAPADDEAAGRIRARHAELAYGGGEDDASPASDGERAEVLAALRELTPGARPAPPGAPLLRA